jgi:hypothetical protein
MNKDTLYILVNILINNNIYGIIRDELSMPLFTYLPFCVYARGTRNLVPVYPFRTRMVSEAFVIPSFLDPPVMAKTVPIHPLSAPPKTRMVYGIAVSAALIILTRLDLLVCGF